PATVSQFRRGCARRGNHSHDVDLPLVIIVRRIEVGIIDQLALYGDARIVDHDVELAELGDHPVYEWLGGRKVTLVAVDGDRTHAAGLQAVNNGLGLGRRVRVADRYIRAAFGERLRQPGAKAAGAAGD